MKLKPCPNCNQQTLRIGTYSEDGASVTEIVCESESCKPNKWQCKHIDSLYIGETEWQYNKQSALNRSNAFDRKWGLA